MNNSRDWHIEGLCVGHPDPDLWHYNNSNYKHEQQLEVLRSVEAIEICKACPVKNDCLQQGLEDENLLWSFGGNGSIWGGLLTSERAQMRGYKPTANSIRHEGRHSRDVKQKLGRLVR